MCSTVIQAHLSILMMELTLPCEHQTLHSLPNGGLLSCHSREVCDKVDLGHVPTSMPTQAYQPCVGAQASVCLTVCVGSMAVLHLLFTKPPPVERRSGGRGGGRWGRGRGRADRNADRPRYLPIPSTQAPSASENGVQLNSAASSAAAATQVGLVTMPSQQHHDLGTLKAAKRPWQTLHLHNLRS